MHAKKINNEMEILMITFIINIYIFINDFNHYKSKYELNIKEKLHHWMT